MGLTAQLARFASALKLEDVPPAAVQAARTAITDCLGVSLAAAQEPIAGVLREYLAEQGAAPRATAIGLGVRSSAELAALAGGAMAHALDFDDVSNPFSGHPTVVFGPAVLAAAEATGATGRQVLEGYIAGFEVGAALGRGLNPHHYHLGWHATSTLGSLGAAAAVSRVLGLDAGQTETAIGIASSLASGIRRNFGSMTKPFHAGSAARAGVAAAFLARLGLTASPAGVEGPSGFAELYAGGVPEALETAVGDLGHRWSLVEDGVWLKFYPCCASTHRSVDAVLNLMSQHGFAGADVEGVISRVPPHQTKILAYPRPATELQAKFSMQYCVAAALTDGSVTLGSFTLDQVERPEVQELMERIEMVAVPVEGETTEVEVTLKDGRRLFYADAPPKGHPLNPLKLAEVEAKFRSCAAFMAGSRANAALTTLARLEELDDIRALMRDLHGE